MFWRKIIRKRRVPIIAIIIKTFQRESVLFDTIDSIYKYSDVNFRLYIYDDSPSITPHKKLFYRKLRSRGHYIFLSNDIVSVTRARNYLINKIDEDYVLRIDDDFQFCRKTSISSMLNILQSESLIGAVASFERQIGAGKGVKDREISDRQGKLSIRNEVLFKSRTSYPEAKNIASKNSGYIECDYTRNFLLLRREMLNDVKWNEKLFVRGEHEDFMLRIKKMGWRLVASPYSIHQHVNTNESNNSTYQYFRKEYNELVHLDVLYDEWGFRDRKYE